MDIFKAVVFILHFFFFGMTAIFYFMKFHQKKGLKPAIFIAAFLWLTFGTIDFVYGLINTVNVFSE